ncbi:MAG: winged helix-turn-helix domain-containing protein, partial [Clostridia bacterium]|nr:winged helix-turn-helix domain-containing protein [Clostridia bacterium]
CCLYAPGPGAPPAAGPRLPAEFSHAEIARAAGTSRETVTRILGTLRRAGIVGEDGGLVLLDRPSLEDWT